MSSDSQSAEEILLRMRGIRRNIRADVKKVVANTTQMLDWKSYVKSFPWASLAIAATVGYLLVPRRMQVIAYDKTTLENYLKERELTAAPAPPPPPPPPQKSLTNEVLRFAGTVAFRVGMAYATRVGMQMMESMTNATNATPAPEQSPVSSRPPVKNRNN